MAHKILVFSPILALTFRDLGLGLDLGLLTILLKCGVQIKLPLEAVDDGDKGRVLEI